MEQTQSIIVTYFAGRAGWAVQESTNDNYTDNVIIYIFHIECDDSALITIKKETKNYIAKVVLISVPRRRLKKIRNLTL